MSLFGKKNKALGGKSTIAALLLAVMCCAGCANIGSADKTPEQIVKDRAAARWTALLAGDFQSAYHYASPSYRSSVSFETFRGQFKLSVQWKTAKVQEAKCSADVCDVLVNIETIVGAGFVKPGTVISSVLTEHWVKEDGGWWMYQ